MNLQTLSASALVLIATAALSSSSTAYANSLIHHGIFQNGPWFHIVKPELKVGDTVRAIARQGPFTANLVQFHNFFLCSQYLGMDESDFRSVGAVAKDNLGDQWNKGVVVESPAEIEAPQMAGLNSYAYMWNPAAYLICRAHAGKPSDLYDSKVNSADGTVKIVEPRFNRGEGPRKIAIIAEDQTKRFNDVCALYGYRLAVGFETVLENNPDLILRYSYSDTLSTHWPSASFIRQIEKAERVWGEVESPQFVLSSISCRN